MYSKSPTYILDTSVVVKWFSIAGELDLDKAHDIFSKLLQGFINVIVPDLLLYELSNALLKSKRLTDREINSLIEQFYRYPMSVEHVDLNRIKTANELAYKYDITVYDAIYLSLAKEFSASLVSANPKHHKPIPEAEVMNLKDW